MENIDSKSKKLLIVLTPVVLLVIILGFSYAYWRKTVYQEGLNKIDTLKCLETTITDESSSINLENEYPIPNSEGMTKAPYTFKVTNTCNIFISTDIALEVLPVSTLNAQYVRVSLNDKDVFIDNSNILADFILGTPIINGATSYILKNNLIFEPNKSRSYDLRIWVDEATTTEQGANKRFEAKAVVIISPQIAPIHLTVSLPNNPLGIYNTDFVGALWNYKTNNLEISNLIEEKNTINLTNIDTIDSVNLASYIISLSNAQGTNGVYNENGYRYEGKNPNNWIMFNGEYWRIIGVFDDATHGRTEENLVKIIREDSIGGLAWDKNGINDWTIASLKNLFNDNYYNGTNEEELTNCYGHRNLVSSNCNFKRNGITNKYYRDMIENVTWKLGGHSTDEDTANNFYVAERSVNIYGSNPITWSGKIGLVYPSDYGYSVPASSCPRNTNLSSYITGACAGQSWLYGKGYEWTLSAHTDTPNNAFYIVMSGPIPLVDSSYGFSVRPTLYLKSDTMVLSGDGSKNNPYILVR